MIGWLLLNVLIVTKGYDRMFMDMPGISFKRTQWRQLCDIIHLTKL